MLSFFLQALQETLEQAAVFFLIRLEFDGEVLRYAVVALARFDDLAVTPDGLVLGVEHATNDAQHIGGFSRRLQRFLPALQLE